MPARQREHDAAVEATRFPSETAGCWTIRERERPHYCQAYPRGASSRSTPGFAREPAATSLGHCLASRGVRPLRPGRGGLGRARRGTNDSWRLDRACRRRRRRPTVGGPVSVADSLEAGCTRSLLHSPSGRGWLPRWSGPAASCGDEATGPLTGDRWPVADPVVAAFRRRGNRGDLRSRSSGAAPAPGTVSPTPPCSTAPASPSTRTRLMCHAA